MSTMTGYSDYICDELRKELRSRGCKVTGRKLDLVQRLEEDDEKNGDISKGGHVDGRGTNNITKDNAGSSPKAKIPVALATLHIYLFVYCLEDSEQYSDSEKVRQLFELIWRSTDVRSAKFGTKQQGKRNQCDNENKAERSYDLNLKDRAAALVEKCMRTEMCDRSEEDWKHILFPGVFRSFSHTGDNQGNPERSAHHCLACRRDFPPNCQPQVHSTRNTTKRRGGKQRSDIEICTLTDRHFNLSNCDYQMELAYHDDDSEVTGKNSYQKPDTTFGLCTYNLDERCWTAEWLKNDMVKLFEKASLKKTLDHFDKLQEPYKISCEPVGIYSYPMFAFGLWEAKKARSQTHDHTVIQAARKLKSLLSWQRRIFDTSEVNELSPTVWFFSSIGADWRVYGCSETKSTDGFRYPLVELWSGSSKNEENALQLLSIVDLIRFWVDYTYKPLIGACISRLEAIKAGTQPTPLDSTLWKLRIPVDREQTPWFFRQRGLKVSGSSIRSTDSLGVPPRGSHRGYSPSSRQSLRPENQPSPRRDHRSPTQAGEQFVMPEKVDFNWLLDRDPGKDDLILIRISETGKIKRPVIIYSTSRLVGRRQMKTVNWKDDDFNAVIEDEKRGHHPKIVSIFRENELGHDYLWQCYRPTECWISRGVQFSMILPINAASYGQQNPESQVAQPFEPLESLFRLRGLLSKIEQANKKWCSCVCVRNERSPPMVQCRNALCDISWFHKKCVGFSHKDVEASWLCGVCKETTEPERAHIEMGLTESNVFARASHDRVHLARAIEDVWREHDWPSQDEIIAKIDKVA